MPAPRPATVVMIAFATGSVTIQCRKTKPEVKALMNVPYFERVPLKDYMPGSDGPSFEMVPNLVNIPSISETDVKEDPRSADIKYRLTNEEIEFARKDVVFWSVSEAVDPPLVLEVPARVLR